MGFPITVVIKFNKSQCGWAGSVSELKQLNMSSNRVVVGIHAVELSGLCRWGGGHFLIIFDKCVVYFLLRQ